MMKGWIKCGLAGAVVLMASFWGGSVRAAGVSLEFRAEQGAELKGVATKRSPASAGDLCAGSAVTDTFGVRSATATR